MKEELTTLPIRLAIRNEGEHYVCAYFCQRHTMDEAILISTLDIRLIGKQEIFYRWKQLMKDILSTYVEEVYGQAPKLDEHKLDEEEGGSIQ